MATEHDVQVMLKLQSTLAAQIKAEEAQVKASMGGMAQHAQGFGSQFNNMSKEVGNSWSGMVKGMVLGWASAEAGIQLVDFTKKGIEAIQEEARASAKLTQSLGYHSEALEKLAQSTAKGTLYKEKDIIAGEAVLSMYTHNETEIKKLLPGIEDLSEALGIGLDSAARIVGKSFDQNTKTLGKTGIAIHGAAGSAERLDSITKALAEHFGGAAKAASDAMGPMGQFPKTMEELQKATAQFVIPSLQFWAQGLKDVVDGYAALDTITKNQASAAEMQKTGNALLAINISMRELRSGKGNKTVLEDDAKRLKDLQTEYYKLKGAEKDTFGHSTMSPSEYKDNEAKMAFLDDQYNALKEVDRIIVSSGEDSEVATEKLKKYARGISPITVEKKHADKKIKVAETPEEIAARNAKIKAAEEEQNRINEVNSRGSEWRLKNYDEEYQESLLDYKNFHTEAIKSQEWANKVLEEDAKRNAKEMEDATKKLYNLEDKELDKTNSGRLTRLKRDHAKELADYKGTAQEKAKLIKIYGKEEADFEFQLGIQKMQFTASLVQNDLQALSTIADASKANAQVKKRLAEGEAIVQGALGVMGVWGATTEYEMAYGSPGAQIAQGIQTAFIVGATIAQVAKIESAKMAYGGVVTGGTPGVDSVPATLMPGEIVYNPAYPNPVLASMINNNSSNSNTTTTNNNGDIHSHIHIHGNPDRATVTQATEIHEAALINALKKAQSRGKIQSTGLKIYH